MTVPTAVTLNLAPGLRSQAPAFDCVATYALNEVQALTRELQGLIDVATQSPGADSALGTKPTSTKVEALLAFIEEKNQPHHEDSLAAALGNSDIQKGLAAVRQATLYRYFPMLTRAINLPEQFAKNYFEAQQNRDFMVG